MIRSAFAAQLSDAALKMGHGGIVAAETRVFFVRLHVYFENEPGRQFGHHADHSRPGATRHGQHRERAGAKRIIDRQEH